MLVWPAALGGESSHIRHDQDERSHLKAGVSPFPILSVPHHTVGAPSFAARQSFLRTPADCGRKGWDYKTWTPHARVSVKSPPCPKDCAAGTEVAISTTSPVVVTKENHFSALRRAEICS